MRLVIASAVFALLASGAVAQTRYGPPVAASRGTGINGTDATVREPTVGRDIDDIREQIRRGRTSGTLTRQDGRRLRREASQIGTLADRYGADGLSDPERRELDARARVLRDVTNAQRTRGASAKR